MRRQMLVGSLVVAALAVAAVVASVALVRNELVRRSAAEMTRQATVTAQIVDNQLARPGEPVRRLGVARLLEQLRLLGGHDYVEIAAVTPVGIVPLLDDGALVSLLTTGAVTDGVVRLEVEGEPVIATVRRVTTESDTGDRIWYVAMGRTEPLLEQGLLARSLALGLAVATVIAAVVAAVAVRRISRRLDVVAVTAGRVAGGDLTARACIGGDDEIATLAESINEMTAKLECAATRQRQFLMDVGHELRTPLTTIYGYLEALEEPSIDSAELSRVLPIVRTQADRLTRLIGDVMLLARLEIGDFEHRTEPVALAPHVARLVAAAERRAAQLEIELRTELADVGVVAADPDRVGQIVANLLDNAMRCTPQGGSIAVTLQRSSAGVEVAVIDNGPGIDPDDLPHVFERRFVAGHHRTLRPAGSGLGLAIVHGLTTAMGGVAEVASTPGIGTRVAVRLPLRSVELVST